MQICSQWFTIRILCGIVENDIRIYLYPQKFTDICKYLFVVPYLRTSAPVNSQCTNFILFNMALNTEGRKVFHCVCFVWLLQMPDDVYDTVQCRGWPTGEVTVTCCQWKDCVQYAWVLLSCYNWCNCWGIFSPSFCVFCVCCKPWRMCAMLSKCNKCLWYSVEYVEYSQKTNG